MRVNLKYGSDKKARTGRDVELFDDRDVKLSMSDVVSVQINAEPREPMTCTVVYTLSGLGDGK
jgi:hypothetical protein